MRNNYKRLGEYIQLVDERNTALEELPLVGLSISKQFINSVANIIGTDLSNNKVIRNNQFACSLMQVSRDEKIPVAMYTGVKAIMSPAYPIFEVIDSSVLLPEYLMMWFSRSEFDRQASYYAVGGVRGNLPWEDFCDMQLPIPHITKQREIVKEYNVIQNRIELNQKLIQNGKKLRRRCIGSGLWSLNSPTTSLRASRMKMASRIKVMVGKWFGVRNWGRRFRRGGN